MNAAADQLALFGEPAPKSGPALPAGWAYRLDFIDVDEERELLDVIATLPLHGSAYKRLSARRRVAHFGTAYDFDDNRLLPAAPAAGTPQPLRAKAAAWLGEPLEAIVSALVAEYRPGVPLGWHRDVPDFESVVGVSLAGSARMRFRRYPPVQPKKADVLSLELAPRSAYLLRAEARWGWQHSVAPTPALRYSITFRTPSPRGARGGPLSEEATPTRAQLGCGRLFAQQLGDANLAEAGTLPDRRQVGRRIEQQLGDEGLGRGRGRVEALHEACATRIVDALDPAQLDERVENRIDLQRVDADGVGDLVQLEAVARAAPHLIELAEHDEGEPELPARRFRPSA